MGIHATTYVCHRLEYVFFLFFLDFWLAFGFISVFCPRRPSAGIILVLRLLRPCSSYLFLCSTYAMFFFLAAFLVFLRILYRHYTRYAISCLILFYWLLFPCSLVWLVLLCYRTSYTLRRHFSCFTSPNLVPGGIRFWLALSHSLLPRNRYLVPIYS